MKPSKANTEGNQSPRRRSTSMGGEGGAKEDGDTNLKLLDDG